jgi:phage protein D
MSALSTLGDSITAALPGDLIQPDFQITVDGENITANLSGRLIDLTLTDNRGFEADSLDITLDDTDSGLALPGRGATVTLALGWKGKTLWDKGSYIIDEVEHSGSPDRMTLRARSAELRGGLTTPLERSFHATTLGEILDRIAQENDLKLAISTDLASLPIAHEDQTNESTANFLTRLSRHHDALCSVKMGTLIFLPIASGKNAAGQTLPTYTITRQSGDNHRFSIAERDGVTAIRATYNDLRAGTKGEIIWGAAEERASLNKPVAAPKTESTGQLKTISGTAKSRAKALRIARAQWKKIRRSPGQYVGVKVAYNDPVQKQATGAKTAVTGYVSYGREDELRAQKAAIKTREKDQAKIQRQTGTTPSSQIDHTADNIRTLRHIYASKESAKRAARAEYKKMQRGLASFSIALACAVPELIPDLPIRVRGWKPEIDATDWISTRITHRLSDNGYVQDIELEVRSTEPPERT